MMTFFRFTFTLLLLNAIWHPTLTQAEKSTKLSVDYFGARFKEGKGVEVSEQSRTILDIHTSEVTEGTTAVTVIPKSSLLKTISGTFVYVVNGKHYLRTAVNLGKSMEEDVEVSDGLFPGDEIVTKGVNPLWYTELQALRGGKACADGH